jgi:hypothetical protein
MHSPDPHSSGPLAYALERWRSLRTKCVWPDDIHDPSPPSVPIMPTCCAAAWPRCNLISRCSGQFQSDPLRDLETASALCSGKDRRSGPTVSAGAAGCTAPTPRDAIRNQYGSLIS